MQNTQSGEGGGRETALEKHLTETQNQSFTGEHFIASCPKPKLKRYARPKQKTSAQYDLK